MTPPKTAYILLWFPKPSETFIFREVTSLWDLGLDLSVYSLYGPFTRAPLSPEMKAVSPRVERLGIPYLKRAYREFLFWKSRKPDLVASLTRKVLARKPKGLEKTGENLWAFLAGFFLARRFLEENIGHIHAPWASGPATAAWTASQLTGIPFSFTARAWDIFPPDNLIQEKVHDALFVRSETANGIRHLMGLTEAAPEKFQLTYNGVPLKASKMAQAALIPPYRFLALGRFVGKKGYGFLLTAMKILKDQGLDFSLILAGDGPLAPVLKKQSRQLGLTGEISFPGFVSHDHVPQLFEEADIFLMPSVVDRSGDRDGIPLVLMEALLHQVPVISTRVAGIPELIAHDETGLLIPEKDPQAIARAVIQLVSAPESARAMAQKGRQVVLDRFDPQKNYRKVFELYSRLAGIERTDS